MLLGLLRSREETEPLNYENCFNDKFKLLSIRDGESFVALGLGGSGLIWDHSGCLYLAGDRVPVSLIIDGNYVV